MDSRGSKVPQKIPEINTPSSIKVQVHVGIFAPRMHVLNLSCDGRGASGSSSRMAAEIRSYFSYSQKQTCSRVKNRLQGSEMNLHATGATEKTVTIVKEVGS